MGKSEEDSIKEKKQGDEKKKKKIVMLFLLAFIIFCFIEGSLSMKKAEKMEGKTEKTQQQQKTYDNKEIESVIGNALNNSMTQTEEVTEDNKTQEKAGDSEISAVSSVEIKGLNEEVLNFIDDDKDGLEKAIREWMNGYGLAEMTSVSFYGECLIDYNKKTVSVSFVVDMESSPGFDAVYNRELKNFSIVPW